MSAGYSIRTRSPCVAGLFCYYLSSFPCPAQDTSGRVLFDHQQVPHLFVELRDEGEMPPQRTILFGALLHQHLGSVHFDHVLFVHCKERVDRGQTDASLKEIF